MRGLILATLVFAAFAACGEFSEGGEAGPAQDAGTEVASPIDAGDAGDAGALSPCPNASCGTVIATSQSNADEVVVDDARIYWTINEDPGSVRARDLASGAPQIVTTISRPRAPYLFSDMIHFASDSAVHHIERSADGGGASLSAGNASGAVTSIARAGGRLFATATAFVHSCVTEGNTCNAQSFAGQYRFETGAGARALTVDRSGTRVWLASDECVVKGEPASGTFVKWWALTDVSAIAADEISVYLGRSGVGGITKFGRDDAVDATPTVLAQNGPPAFALVESGAFVFYTAIDQGVVMKVAKDGAVAKIVASGLPRPKGIAVRLEKVYVALGDGRVVAIPH
jgi:hypothetical protein